MAFLPLISREDRVFRSDSALKYFVSQRAASVIFLSSYLIINSYWPASFIIFLSMVFKTGLAPFHGWIVRIFFSADLITLLLIGTIQKAIPLHVLSNSSICPEWLTILVLLNSALLILLSKGAAGVRLVLLLSSIANGLWLLRSMFASARWLKFLFIYALITGTAVFFLIQSRSLKPAHLSAIPPLTKGFLRANFLSLGGLPPFLGFLPKLIILKALASAGISRLIALIILPSLIILWTYLALTLRLYSVRPGAPLRDSSAPSSVIIVGALILFTPLAFLL